MVKVCYYTRRGCHLCDVMLEELLPLLRGRAEIQLRDIDSNPEWLRRHDIRVPVVEVNGEIISEYPLDRAAIGLFLAGLPDSEGQSRE